MVASLLVSRAVPAYFEGLLCSLLTHTPHVLARQNRDRRVTRLVCRARRGGSVANESMLGCGHLTVVCTLRLGKKKHCRSGDRTTLGQHSNVACPAINKGLGAALSNISPLPAGHELIHSCTSGSVQGKKTTTTHTARAHNHVEYRFGGFRPRPPLLFLLPLPHY